MYPLFNQTFDNPYLITIEKDLLTALLRVTVPEHLNYSFLYYKQLKHPKTRFISSIMNTKLSPSPQPSTSSTSSPIQTPNQSIEVEGCQKCGKDDDHPHLLLCENCNDEWHTYCLDPPLTKVPDGDFFCTKCKHLLQIFVNNTNDELDQRVAALNPSFTQRFGEIIWAYGGNGFGWWPACIYDPRLTVGGARKLALKNMGKKHLVYFFGCTDAPFTVLPDNKCMAWIDGLMEDWDTGKVAKSTGKNRAMMFEWALQAAITENDKPIECRLDWNHEEDPFIINNKVKIQQNQVIGGVGVASNNNSDNKKKASTNTSVQNEKKRKRSKSVNQDDKNDDNVEPMRKSNRSAKPSSLLASLQQQQEEKKKKKKTNHQSVTDVLLHAIHDATEIEDSFDNDHGDQFFCKILFKSKSSKSVGNSESDEDKNGMYDVNIGFIMLSKKSSTFADARKKIKSEFDEDNDLMLSNWKFYIPHLGPMSKKQETMFGSMFEMLLKNGDGRIGSGSSRNPLKVIIYEI